MRGGKEQVRETKSPVNRLPPRHGMSVSTLPSQEAVQFASGERGCVIEQTLQWSKEQRQQVGVLVGTRMVRKKVGRQRVVVQRRTGGLYRSDKCWRGGGQRQNPFGPSGWR